MKDMRYRIFGRRAGLRVSELALGAGNFGTRWGHGCQPGTRFNNREHPKDDYSVSRSKPGAENQCSKSLHHADLSECVDRRVKEQNPARRYGSIRPGP